MSTKQGDFHVLGASMLVFVWNAVRSFRYGEVTRADDPWGYGNSLEWATSSPPPRYNFTALPRIRSERPAFELHHPWLAERLAVEGRQTPKRRDWVPMGRIEIDEYLSEHPELLAASTNGSANGSVNGSAN